MLTGKRVVVSGGAQGMGRAIVLLLAAQGASVVFSDLDEAAGRMTCEEAKAADPDCLFVHADMGDAEQTARFAQDALQHLCHVDCLVNVVGINRRQPAAETDMAVFNRLLEVNVKSILRLSKAFWPGMAAAGGGAIVNISSIHAQASMTGFSAYAATKGAIESLTRVMAIDGGPQHIRVNAISPGAIYTSEMRSWWEGRETTPPDYDLLLAHQPMIGPGLATDIAHAVLFLLSDMAGYLTGSVLRVDGGAALQAHPVSAFPVPPGPDAASASGMASASGVASEPVGMTQHALPPYEEYVRLCGEGHPPDLPAYPKLLYEHRVRLDASQGGGP